MAEHLLSNVYQVGGGDITHPLDGASYLIVDTEKQKHVLIDCGSPLGFAALKLSCAEVGVEMESVSSIILTHIHYDHSAAAPSIDAPVYVHEAGLEALHNRDEDSTATFLYDGQTYPEIRNVIAIDSGFEMNIGKTALRAIHTPGHSPDSVSYELTTPDGIIIVLGDMLWGGFHIRMGSSFSAWEASFDKLATSKARYATFGHGVSKLVPNARAHIGLARSRFRRELRPSHDGRLFNPWSEPKTNHRQLVATTH